MLLEMFSCSDAVSGAESVTIDYSAAGFSVPPIITATAHTANVNVFVSNVTTTTAVLNFSQKFTGTVGYIARARE
tara:strand:- start:806 stop:1030 length:225 start_codon:yes stop_codon:yes gene_type:complete